MHFRDIFELPSHLICILGPDGKFIETNIAQKVILDWEPSELIGKNIGDFLHPDDVAPTVAAVGRLFAEGGTITEFRNRARHRDGSCRWISWSGTLSKGNVVAIGTDVTAQIEAEEQARIRETQFYAFFDSLPLLAGITKPDGSVVFVNRAWRAFMGLGPEDPVDRELAYSRIHRDDVDSLRRAVAENKAKGRGYEADYRLRTLDGEYRWFTLRSNPLPGSTHWVNTAADIHDQVVARERLHDLFMQAPACITVNRGPNHVYEFSNALNNEILGRDDLVGRSAREIFDTDEGSRAVLTLIDEIYRNGQTRHLGELPVTRNWHGTPGLSTRYLSATLHPLRDSSGEICGVMTFSIDVTAQVEARREIETAREKAEAANRAKSEFVANMSHEIRTPLAAITGFSDLALEEPNLSDNLRQWLERIRANGQQLMSLIGDVLDLSKVEAGSLTLNASAVAVGPFVVEAVSSLLSLSKNKGLTLEVDVSAVDGLEATTDPTILKQILQNLVSNAIKFTDHGGVKIVASRAGDTFVFDVEDTGIGIEPSAIEKLFKPFSQGDTSLTRKFGGTGLGLLLSRRFAKKLGGDVTLLRTTSGRGSVFRATVRNLEARSATASTETRPRTLVLDPRHILLVEDSADNQALVKLIFAKAGREIDVASNGAEALEKADRREYDLVLMDLQMPVMDGYETTSRLRRNGFKGKIVALTAHALSDERHRALGNGFDDYLTKPLHKSALLDLVKSR